tara:strand:+ start:47 stop:1120 length:1074 start_codon:yes stop_codon:yes gene_type:complete
MQNISNFYKGKKVLVTGATGFKGSWLCAWLLKLGAKVYGLGFYPNENRKLFYSLSLDQKIKLKLFDIRDITKLKKFINKSKPSIIFHLAAQSLVLNSYKEPFLTFDVNTRGTLNILECSRKYKFVKSIILVTSDKCYKNVGKIKRYKEDDYLGGTDPYSASKASTEILIKSYRENFFNKKINQGISSARAGNVIGGGDWASNRLIPDCIKFIKKNTSIKLRNPKSNRPWQFILESLSGYLILGKKQFLNPKKYSSEWNFGPDVRSIATVKDIVNQVIKFWGKGSIKILKKQKLKEQINLQLDIKKAKNILKWRPTYNLKTSLYLTLDWYYKVLKNKSNPLYITNKQIEMYMKKSKLK